jgi:DNA repair exonuclease SbcCD ATPase subunit
MGLSDLFSSAGPRRTASGVPSNQNVPKTLVLGDGGDVPGDKVIDFLNNNFIGGGYRLQSSVPNTSNGPKNVGGVGSVCAGTAANSSYRLNKIRYDVKNTAETITRLEGTRAGLLSDLKRNQDIFDNAVRDLDLIEKSMILLQTVSDLSRQKVKGQIESTVSMALDIVYGGSHQYKIELNQGKNGPEAHYWLHDGSSLKELKKPRFIGVSGGKIDIISLVSWLVVNEMIATTGPLIIDEPGHNVETAVIPNLAYFLNEYLRRFDRQILVTTHHEGLKDTGEKSIHIVKRDGISEVRQ